MPFIKFLNFKNLNVAFNNPLSVFEILQLSQGLEERLYVVMEKQGGYSKNQSVTLRRESSYVREQIGSQDVSQNKLRKHLEAFPV